MYRPGRRGGEEVQLESTNISPAMKIGTTRVRFFMRRISAFLVTVSIPERSVSDGKEAQLLVPRERFCNLVGTQSKMGT